MYIKALTLPYRTEQLTRLKSSNERKKVQLVFQAKVILVLWGQTFLGWAVFLFTKISPPMIKTEFKFELSSKAAHSPNVLIASFVNN